MEADLEVDSLVLFGVIIEVYEVNRLWKCKCLEKEVLCFQLRASTVTTVPILEKGFLFFITLVKLRDNWTSVKCVVIKYLNIISDLP